VRRLLAGLLAGVLALSGAASLVAPSVAAAVAVNPKVVLVVGATHATTPTYRAWMEVTYRAVRQYTSNVLRIYSPNATWSAVKSAMAGASIVVYMGHGNGFPNPYVTFPRPDVQNGMGLNAVAGQGDSNTKYYGESYMDDVRLAPNAVVILSHNCYASGNSEPGNPEPSLSVAKARLDNFAAGFIRAGARAVIADGHGDPDPYITALFTTRQTIEQIWRAAPDRHDNVFTFASVRSSGYTAFSDPDHASGSTYTGFYRSLVARPDLRSEDVTGARYARTDGTPGAFVVPGAAEVTAPAGAGIFPDATLTPDPGTGLAPDSLPTGTRVRLLENAGPGLDGSPILHVATLAGEELGWVLGSGLSPRDSTAPLLWQVEAGSGAFSPNGDGRGDSITVTSRASESVSWTVRFADAGGTVLRSVSGSGEDIAASWNGLVDGDPVPDGTYGFTISARDLWGNPEAVASGTVRVDTVPPDLAADGAPAPALFTPNGDGVTDTTRLGIATSEPGSAVVTVRDEGGATVDAYSVAVPGSTAGVTWDGRAAGGAYVPDGRYSIEVVPQDAAGNRGAPQAADAQVFAALGSVRSSVSVFYPQDGDGYAKTVGLSFVLHSPVTVTWTIRDAVGNVVRTRCDAAALEAGTYSFAWNGRNDAGAYVPKGHYYSTVTATDGVRSTTQRAAVVADAFRIVVSDTTPARGQRISITLYTAEPLARYPRVTISQPGYAKRYLNTTKISSTGYRVYVTLGSGGTPGTLGIRGSGYDAGSRYQWSKIALPLH